MLRKVKKRYFARIPKEVSVVHCDRKNILYFSGPQGSKTLKLNVKVMLLKNYNIVVVSDTICETNLLHLTKKKIKMARGLVVARIKQIVTEITCDLYRKLNLVGVGYRAFPHSSIPNQIYFKLGFSHPIFFNVPANLYVKIHKFTKLYVYGGNSIDALSLTVSNIRNCKLPEPYKGKGVLYDQEAIVLKKGKKI